MPTANHQVFGDVVGALQGYHEHGVSATIENNIKRRHAFISYPDNSNGKEMSK